jgi:inner membrane protein
MVDTFRSTVATDPGHDLFYKPQLTPAIRAAMRSYLGQVYLDWSSWPLVSDIGPAVPPDAPPGAPACTAISFRDLRFLYDTSLIQGRTNPPLSGMVYVDASGGIVRMELGGRVQR